MSLKGSCLCGAVRYTAESEPIFSGHCHCLDCQKESGCGHITVAAVPDATVTVHAVRRTASANSEAAVSQPSEPSAKHAGPRCSPAPRRRPA